MAHCHYCGGDAEPGTVCPKSLTCPAAGCGAAPGQRCRRPSGHPADELHAGRVELAESIDAGTAVCGFCGEPGATDVHREDGYPAVPCCADEEACRERFDALNAEPAPVDVIPCPRCGQLAAPGDGTVCGPCRDLERAPQGERMSLFTPAPAVPAGSLTMF